MGKNRELSVDQGLTIQASQLEEYECVLTPEAYAILEKEVKKDNDKAETGYDVLRGTRICEILSNVVMRHFFPKKFPHKKFREFRIPVES